VAGVDSFWRGVFRLGVAVALRTVYPCRGSVVGSGLVIWNTMSTSSGGPQSNSASSSGDISISTGIEVAVAGCSVAPDCPVDIATSGVLASGTGVLVGPGAGFSRRYCWEVVGLAAFFCPQCSRIRDWFQRCLEFCGGAVVLCSAGGLWALFWSTFLVAGGAGGKNDLGRGTSTAMSGWGVGRSNRADCGIGDGRGVPAAGCTGRVGLWDLSVTAGFGRTLVALLKTAARSSHPRV
jgi:hypothetical protein